MKEPLTGQFRLEHIDQKLLSVLSYSVDEQLDKQSKKAEEQKQVEPKVLCILEHEFDMSFSIRFSP